MLKKNRKILLIILLVIICTLIYLNRAYAYFYDYLHSANLHQPVQKPILVGSGQKILKYVSLGDSLSAGAGSQNINNNYPYLLAQQLSNNNTTVELNNIAVPGANSLDVLNNQIPRAITQKPDLITLMIGINDIHNWVGEQIFKENLQKIISILKKNTEAKIVVIDIPYLGNKKILLFPYDILFNYETQQFNKIIKTIAAADNIKYIDLYSQMLDPFKSDDSFYSIDYFHPSDKGYMLWANYIYENLSQ